MQYINESLLGALHLANRLRIFPSSRLVSKCLYAKWRHKSESLVWMCGWAYFTYCTKKNVCLRSKFSGFLQDYHRILILFSFCKMRSLILMILPRIWTLALGMAEVEKWAYVLYCWSQFVLLNKYYQYSWRTENIYHCQRIHFAAHETHRRSICITPWQRRDHIDINGHVSVYLTSPFQMQSRNGFFLKECFFNI